MKMKESNEQFTARIVDEIDKWQDGNRKRVAMLVMQDETGKSNVEAFADNRGKNPQLRFVGRMVGIAAHHQWLYEMAVMVAKYTSKMLYREAKRHAKDQ